VTDNIFKDDITRREALKTALKGAAYAAPVVLASTVPGMVSAATPATAGSTSSAGVQGPPGPQGPAGPQGPTGKATGGGVTLRQSFVGLSNGVLTFALDVDNDTPDVVNNVVITNPPAVVTPGQVTRVEFVNVPSGTVVDSGANQLTIGSIAPNTRTTTNLNVTVTPVQNQNQDQMQTVTNTTTLTSVNNNNVNVPVTVTVNIPSSNSNSNSNSSTTSSTTTSPRQTTSSTTTSPRQTTSSTTTSPRQTTSSTTTSRQAGTGSIIIEKRGNTDGTFTVTDELNVSVTVTVPQNTRFQINGLRLGRVRVTENAADRVTVSSMTRIDGGTDSTDIFDLPNRRFETTIVEATIVIVLFVNVLVSV